MKSILQIIDLAICTIWVMCFFGDTCCSVNNPEVVLFFTAVVLRLTLNFILEKCEKKAWIPLVLYSVMWVGMMLLHANSGIGSAGENFCLLFGLEFNRLLDYVVSGGLLFWIVVMPYLVYLCLLLSHRVKNTELSKWQMWEGVLWQDRKVLYALVFLSLIWAAHLVGLSLYMRLCMVACMTIVPVAYWLICDYQRVKKQSTWLVVVAMMLFWYAQFCDTVLRFICLFADLGLIVYACSTLYQTTRNLFKVSIIGVVVGIVLPCLSVGYNAYNSIDYPITGRVYASSHYNFLEVGNSMQKDKVGLRDRHGLVVTPEYDAIRPEEVSPNGVVSKFRLSRGPIVEFYNVISNEILSVVDNESEVEESESLVVDALVSKDSTDNVDTQTDVDAIVMHTDLCYFDFDKEKSLSDFFTDMIMDGHNTEVRDESQLEKIMECIAAIDKYRKKEWTAYPDELVSNCLDILGAECGYAYHHGIPVDFTFAEWFMMCAAYYSPDMACLVNVPSDDGTTGLRYFGRDVNSTFWWTYSFEKRKKGFEVKLIGEGW